MAIKNPEKECQSTPEKFSDVSRISDVVKYDNTGGIILDSPEEFAQALIVYGSGSIREAKATQINLMDAIGEEHGGMGIAYILKAGALANADEFTKRLAEEACSSLKSTGRFNEEFDYTLNNFQKTAIFGKKVGDKYVLDLSVAYVGSEPEKKLAETMEKPLALVNSNVKGKLTVIDGWWFNVNLEDVLQGLPVSKKQLKGLPVYIASGGYSGENPEIEFKHNGQKFSLDIGLDDTVRYLIPEGEKPGSDYIQARGKFIVGGAWTTWAENDNDRIAPKSVQPAVFLQVSLPGRRYPRPVAVTEEQMKAVQSARDYLAEIIQPKK